MPSICLTMIVKDEGHLIRDTLKHLLTYIRFDTWCICDTGSTDNTIQEIEEFFAEQGIPGAIHRHEWRDFAHNRTLAFQCAYGLSDYAFVWDADDEIVGDFKLPTNMIHDWYRFTFGARGCTQYRRGQLFNNRKKWKYVGVLHECASCMEDCAPPHDVLGDYHFVSGRRGARSKDPMKYHKDALILEKAYTEALSVKDDLYKRYAFYCAQSYLCAGNREKAIEFYKKVLELDTWSQEQYVSCMEIYDSYEELGRAKEGLFYLVEAFRYDSQRAECVLRLVKYYLNAGLPQVSLMYYRAIQPYYENTYAVDALQEKLFVKRCDPDFYLPYFMIIVGERTKDLSLCARMFDAIITYKFMGVTAWWIQNTFHNLQFFIAHIPKTFDYLQKIMSYLDMARARGILLQDAQNNIIQAYIRSCEGSLCEPCTQIVSKTDRVHVMLTMTTCKRLDLFQKTVRSILTTWTDLDEVDFFFCVDDASSVEDREAMATEFPFFTFYMKKSHEKGHRESMNIIWAKLAEVKPKYWIHLEDDWLFFRKRSYVKESIDFLTRYKDQNIHQILFNRNYAETFNDWGINGGIPLEAGFFLHSNEPVEGRNCAYWKHYSFRPSMVLVDTILELGDYTTPNTFFEGDYAERYSGKGYKSAFFDTISSLHIGKLTSDKSGVNAYTLNKVSQFKETKANTYIVNLERRPDRKKAMEELFESQGIDYSFFKAVDGKSLVVTEEIVRLFTGNDFSNRKGVIGCAMSHYMLWKQLSEDTGNEYYIIYEDDITLCDDYKNKLDGVIRQLDGRDFVLLGYHVFRENSLTKTISAEGLVQTNKNAYIGGFFSYIITKSGCKKLLNYIEKNGIKHGIDYIIKICPELNIYNPQPHIVFSEWVETMDSPIDTDIQKDYSQLNLNLDHIKNGWVYYDGVDSSANDICYINKPLNELFTIASMKEGCVAFNTLGYLKHKATLPFGKTPYINSPGRGIYVKRDYVLTTSWISSELCGGIGNRLFQISAAIGLADRLGRRVIFYDPCVKEFSHQYSKNIYALFPNITVITEREDFSWEYERGKPYEYMEIQSNTNKNILLSGYRQTNKYFPPTGIFPNFISKCGLEVCAEALTTYRLADEKVRYEVWSIHIRLGDYSSNTHVNHINIDSFYSLAIKKIPDTARIILFSDEPEKATALLAPLGRIFDTCYEKDECLSLYIMQHCWGGAIVPNSTFGWWGAYLAQNTCKSPLYKAYYPIDWYSDAPNSGLYYAPSWGECIGDRIVRVKMLCNWCSSEALCAEWNKMSKGGNRWNSIQITSEDTNIDYYVIINKPRAGDVFIPEKTIIFHMEPWCGESSQTWGVKTWGEWARPDPAKFLQVRSHDSFVNTGFWQLNKSYTELQASVVKDEQLDGVVSSICSSKYFDPGHIKRIDFMKYIESKGGVQLHIYNEDNKHGFASYKGTARPSIDKEKGILPYKYYFMCENNAEKNFITEKLWEPILCESLCFYWGCPNVSEYINPLAYVQLDMDDFESSYQIVLSAIRDNLWEKRVEVIREEKKKVLEKYNFFPTLERVVKERVVCFIHSCNLGSGTATLDLLLESVLLQKEIETIYIHNIGLPLPAKYSDDARIKIRQESDNPGEFELPTLRRISEFSKRNPRAKILYLHTKGISYSKTHPYYSNVQDWIAYMLYFVCQVPRCVQILDSYDTAGCNRLEKPHHHYSGNFWWATAKYINTLSLDSLTDKMSAEWWILSGKANAYTLKNSDINHFHEPYPRERYSNT